MPSKPMALPYKSREVVEGAVDQILAAQGNLEEAMLSLGLDEIAETRQRILATSAPLSTAQRALDALLAQNPNRAQQILSGRRGKNTPK